MMRIHPIAAFAFIASASAHTASAQDATPSPIPMPGRLVDIGGWRLHLHCTGSARAGQPTVVLEAGAGDLSLEWSLVQPEVAKFARVCSYDRAGMGWSELGPYPRTFHQIAYELHMLLDKAGEAKPYLLVAHSFGGWPVRTFQMMYASDVAGMVLVEAGHDDPLRLQGDGTARRASELPRGVPVPEVKTAGPLRVESIPAPAMSAIRAGMADMQRRALEPPRDRLPADVQRVRVWSFTQIGMYVNGNPAELEERAQLRTQRASSEFPLGDLPLIVFTRGKSDDDGPDAKANEAVRRAEHAAVARMSRRGQHRIAEQSGHHIQIEQPDLVTGAIRQIIGMK